MDKDFIMILLNIYLFELCDNFTIYYS